MAMDFPTTQSVANYFWRENGTGGVDYFIIQDWNGTNKLVPITREQFSAGTAAAGSPQDVGAIEQWARDNYSPTTEQSTQQPIQQTSGTTGGTTTPFQGYFGGQYYQDPQAYADAQRAYVEQMYNTNIGTLGRQYDEYGRVLNQNESDLNTNYGRQTSALSEALNRGKFKTAQTFDYIAPSMYQSGETVSLAEKNKDYNTGMTDLGTERQRSLDEITRGRSDLAYYRPLEEQQYAQTKQSQIDAILNQLLENQATPTNYNYTNEGNLNSAMTLNPQVQASNYNTVYQAPDQSNLIAGIAGAPNVGGAVQTATNMSVGKKPKTIYDYLYGLYA